MNRVVFSSFVDELEKHAVSAARTLAVLESRAAQGARVHPTVLQGVRELAAGGATSTPIAARKATLNVAESARGARSAERAWAGPKSDLVNRFESTPVKYDMSKPLKTHEGYMGGEHRYTPEYIKSVTASPATVEMTPRALAQAAPQPPAMAGTAVSPIKARRAVSSSGIQPSAGATVPGRPGAARGGDTVLAPVTGFERTTLVPASRVAV
jgi:hypothetical protein